MRTIPFGKPLIGDGEKRAVRKVLSGTTLVHGPWTKEFEAAFKTFTKAPFAVAVSSCTAALHLTYFHFGIRKGDEVIVPAQTHTATAHAVELCQAKPVFVDAEKDTGNIDIGQIESAITPRTRAISVVHFLGMPVNMDKVTKIAKRHNLFVIEDCALAIGTYFKGVHAGLFGDAGCFSFYPVKHIATGEGGMLITKDEKIASDVYYKRAFGVDRGSGGKKMPGMYDVRTLGFNYRISEIEAALGVKQLERIGTFLKKRKYNYECLNKGLMEIDELRGLVSTHDDYQSSYYCYSAILNKRLGPKRSDIIQILNKKGVGTSIYYPKPVPHMSYYKNKYGYDDKSFPVAKWISDNSIALPVGPHLGAADMRYVIAAVKAAIKEVR